MVKEVIPSWLKRHLTVKEAARIEESVRLLESQTSGEIVPMIVHRSTCLGHVPMQVLSFLVLFYLAATISYPSFGFLSPVGLETSVLWIWAELMLLLIGGLALARVPFIARLLTPKADQMRQVHMRAELEFFEAGLQKTAGSTGVLLFISIFERRAVVLADKSIAAQLPPDTWEGVVNLLVKASKRGDLADGFIQAIGKTGELLIPRFPAALTNVNELADQLIIKE
jgi:putative membrane protein